MPTIPPKNLRSRKKVIAANWKMNITSSQVPPYLKTLLSSLLQSPLASISSEEVDIILIPSFTSLPKASELLADTQNIPNSSRLFLGAQNFYFQEKGAFTGEISPAMLRDLGVEYVLVGHSERRQLFGETPEIVHQKMIAAHTHDFLPILCIGETLEERQAHQEKTILERQLTTALQGLRVEKIADTLIAYEPVWAIGTGISATLEQAQEAHHFIREVLAGLVTTEVAQRMRLQYGGSVTPANALLFFQAPDIDGALVGSASLNPNTFIEIILKT